MNRLPRRTLLVLEAHPVQYHAPVYQALAKLGCPIIVGYGSDFSVAGYMDTEFSTKFSWDTNLLEGYEYRFLSRVESGGGKNVSEITGQCISQLISEVQPAAILANGYTSRFDRASLYHGIRSRCPLLFRAETTDAAQERSRFKTAVRDTALKLLYGRMHKLLYIGQKSLKHYRRLRVSDDKLIPSRYCVYTGPFLLTETDRTTLRSQQRSAYNLRKDQVLLLFSGKLIPRKGVDLILPAIRRLPEDIRRMIVVGFLGDGELRDSLQASAQEQPAVPVIFVGFKNQTQLSSYYHAADALILPSRQMETWGLVVNEALHHGLPVVVSDTVGCAEDLVHEGQTGFIFGNEDVVSLSQAITNMVGLQRDLKLRDACRRVVASYSVSNAAHGIFEAFGGQ